MNKKTEKKENADKRYKVTGYVSSRDLLQMKEKDVKALDVINIAFGKITEGEILWEEAEREGARQAVERLRKIHPDLSVVLSVGGWGADGFSQAASCNESRNKLAKSVVRLIRETGIDGVDIDWEYPGFSLAGIASSREDASNYVLLLKALHEAVKSEKADGLVTAAVGGDTYFVRQTNMKEAARYLDAVLLMTYDLQGGFQTVTGHHSPLYAAPCNLMDACVHKAVTCFTEAGVEAEKLSVGIPFYSRQWTSVKAALSDCRGLGMESAGIGGYGADYGTLYEEYINKNGYVRYWDDVAQVPYLFNGDTFISYEDEESIAAKIRYVKEKGLAGLMFWEYKCDSTGSLLPFMRKMLDK